MPPAVNAVLHTDPQAMENDMQIRLALHDTSPAMRMLRRELAELRERLALAVARRALVRIIQRTPVDTGRLRAAWARALEDLGGTGAAAIADGTAPGSAAVHETAGASVIEIENAVPYAAADVREGSL